MGQVAKKTVDFPEKLLKWVRGNFTISSSGNGFFPRDERVVANGLVQFCVARRIRVTCSQSVTGITVPPER